VIGAVRRIPDLVLVVAGGALGALARVALAAAYPVQEGRLPWTTLAENVSGAFLLAALLTVLVERAGAHARLRALLCTGMLGAFTTYSTLATELTERAIGGQAALAVGYAALSLTTGVLAAGAGLVVGHRIAVRFDGRKGAQP
jgi:fluoride exporter